MSEEAKRTLSVDEFDKAVMELSLPMLQHLIIWVIGQKRTFTALNEAIKLRNDLEAYALRVSIFKGTGCHDCDYLIKAFSMKKGK